MDDIPLDGKRVIVRVDFNVTIGKDGKVGDTEDYRIEAALSTINELQQRRCKILLLSHQGRPQDNPEDADMSPVHKRLEYLLQEEVRMLPKLYGSGVDAVVSGMEQGSIALYPNVRTDDREENVNEKFGKDLAQVGEAYINEAFSVSHRDHTSVSLLPRLMMSCAGRRTVQEVQELDKLRQNPQRPYVAIVSGAKIETKVALIRKLLEEVDTVCVGGQIANIFLAAQGKWKHSSMPKEEITLAKELLELGGFKLLIPSDVIVGEKDGTNVQTVSVESIPTDASGLWDIGPQSTKAILDVCRTAKTIMWNGPLGMCEVQAYADSTKQLAELLPQLPAHAVVGGGDTVNALKAYKVINKYGHVSVGGGAMVAFLDGSEMPGLTPLYSS